MTEVLTCFCLLPSLHHHALCDGGSCQVHPMDQSVQFSINGCCNHGHESEHRNRDLSLLWSPGECIIQTTDLAYSELHYSASFSSSLDAACDEVEHTGLKVAVSSVLTWDRWLSYESSRLPEKRLWIILHEAVMKTDRDLTCKVLSPAAGLLRGRAPQ